MDQSLQTFLNTSPISKKVKIKGKVVLQRKKMTARDIVSIRQNKTYGVIPEKEKVCELELGGQVLAYGKIIKQKGEYYFKITQIEKKQIIKRRKL